MLHSIEYIMYKSQERFNYRNQPLVVPFVLRPFCKFKKLRRLRRKIYRYLQSRRNEILTNKSVYYNNTKYVIPDSWYISYKKPAVKEYLNYLKEQDDKLLSITDGDREKARLLKCNLDYVYLQELINKVNSNSNLNVTITTADGAIIRMDTNKRNIEDDAVDYSVFEPKKL